MAAVLAVSIFLVFVMLDYVVTRVRGRRAGGAQFDVTSPALRPAWVAGFEMREGLHYQRGHTWARVVSEGIVVSASALFGGRDENGRVTGAPGTGRLVARSPRRGR